MPDFIPQDQEFPMKSRLLLSVVLTGFVTLTSVAQQTAPVSSSALANPVPNLINYSGILKDATGRTLSGITGVTFLLYKDEQGGVPLWLETQNVQPDKTGHYYVQLGAVSKNGIPPDLFTSGEARWLALQIGSEPEQPRVLLVAVPYAMKAVDAQTLGGLPPSAFVLASPPASSTAPSATAASSASSVSTVSPTASSVTTNGGTGNTIAMFSTATDIENSILTQSGTTAININGALNLPATGTATSTTAFNSQAEDFVASVFNGTSATAQTFQWQAEPLNNGKTTASGTLNLLYAAGTSTPGETGLNINSKGQFTFASGQKFPGTGTVTSVAAGAGLAGGTITKSGTLSIGSSAVTNAMLQNSSLTVNPGTALTGGGPVSLGGSTTLSVDTTKVPLLAAANTFTANQTVNGSISATQLISNAAQGTAPLQVTSTTQVANLNASFLDGFSASAFQTAGSYATLGSNSFSATQSINSGDVSLVNGDLDLPQTTSPTVGVINVGGNPFMHACCDVSNILIGAGAGNFTMSGNGNTAVGSATMQQNTTGYSNAAFGLNALQSNTTGNLNTATGGGALQSNTSGSLNVASGLGALQGNTTGSNNVGIGYTAGNTTNNQNTTGSSNTYVGVFSNPGTQTTLNNVTAIGASAQVTANNATAIGANAQATASNSLVLGSINGVNGATASTNVGIGTTTPAATLDVHGTGNFTGLITFASGQTFPGAGTITGITAGTDLLGGGTTGAVTLNVDTTKLVTSVLAGADLTGGGTGGVQTLNLDTTKVPLLAAANTFTANQTVTGNLTATGVVTGSSFQIGSNLFDYGYYANANAFLGFAGNTTTTGGNNTASGFQALHQNTTGISNTATGDGALYSNSTGGSNTATGVGALFLNTAGSGNTASGGNALLSNTIGYDNTASGFQALDSNTTGYYNTASGWSALLSNTSACCNTASGFQALYSNSTGTGNLAEGFQALYWATGNNNTAIGTYAGNPTIGNPTFGSSNTYVGYQSNSGTYFTLNNATAIGANAQVTASNAIVLGSINGVNNATASAFVGIGTTAPTYLLHIGNQGGTSYNNFLRVEGPGSGSGNAISVGGNGDVAVDAPGVPAGRFVVKNNGIVAIGIPNPLGNPFQIAQGKGNALADGWATYSSRRWKTNIHSLPDALSKVKRLRGVSYDLKNSGKHEIGVIAEEVGEVIPEVVSYEENGKDARGVDYGRLTALLIEAVKQQQEQIASLRLQLRQQALKHARLESRLAQLEGDRDGHSRLASAKPLSVQPAH
jgi:hypothetical protein